MIRNEDGSTSMVFAVLKEGNFLILKFIIYVKVCKGLCIFVQCFNPSASDFFCYPQTTFS